MDYGQFLVRIRSLDRVFICCGFLVSRTEVLTSAHALLNLHLTAIFVVDFPMLPSVGTVVARAKATSGVRGGDIAILELERPTPPETAQAPLLATDRVWQHDVKAYGFPFDTEIGAWVRGQTLDGGPRGYVQINTDATGYRIQPGFSGSPVWDEKLGGVTGMIVRAESSRVTRAGFMISVQQLVEEWPDLKDRVRPVPADSDRLLHDIERRLLTYASGVLDWKVFKEYDRFNLTLLCGSEKRQLREVLAEHSRLVITGAPGSGKSVFLLKALHEYCDHLRSRLSSRHRPSRRSVTIPVYVELGRLSAAGVRPADLTQRLLENLGFAVGNDAMGTLCSLLEDERWNLLLLLDGLNELPKRFHEAAVNQLIAIDRALMARNRQSHLQVVVTSRSYGFTNYFENEAYEIVEIIPLDPDAILSELQRALPRHERVVAALFDRLDPKVKQLLSNPQNLDNLIEWCRETIERGQPLEIGLRTRGALLDHCVERKLRNIELDVRGMVLSILSEVGYQTCQSGPFFPRDALMDTIKATLNRERSELSPNQLMSKLIGSGLLDITAERCRFSHHSIQQYFAARRMRQVWNVDQYIEAELWHEPLVIMSGLLDREKLNELLDRLRTKPRLYAYVLANVQESAIEREFLLKTVDAFVRQLRRWAKQLWRRLTVAAVLWTMALPVIALALAGLDPDDVSTRHQLWILLGIGAYVGFGPAAFLTWHRRQFRLRLSHLRETTLPDLIAVLRFLLARGAMNSVLRELSQLRRTLKAADEDPRVAFINEAITLIASAVNNTSYMSDDQMLENLADPLVAEEIAPDRLSGKNLERLFEIALEDEDGPAVQHAVERLRELYIRSPDHRERTLRTLRQIASARHRSRRTRKLARAACQELSGKRTSFFTRLIEVLRYVLGGFNRMAHR